MTYNPPLRRTSSLSASSHPSLRQPPQQQPLSDANRRPSAFGQPPDDGVKRMRSFDHVGSAGGLRRAMEANAGRSSLSVGAVTSSPTATGTATATGAALTTASEKGKEKEKEEGDKTPPNQSTPPPSSTSSAPTSANNNATAPSPSPAPSPLRPSVSQPSLSSTRRVPVLPNAGVTKAPPTGMYWSRTPSSGPKTPRGLRAHSATLVESTGEVWVFGGCDLGGRCSREVWKFDVDSFIWQKPRILPDPSTKEYPPVTRAHTAIHVDGKIYVVGGGDGPTYYNDLWILDTLSLTWSHPRLSSPPPSRRRAHTGLLYQTKLLLFGGGNGSHALNDFWTLELGGGAEGLEWRKVETRGRKPISRGYHTMSLVGSKVVVFGGSDGTECFSDVWVLDLESLQWTEINLEPTSPGPASAAGGPSYPRLSHTTTVVGSYLFVIGGHDGVNFSNEIVLFNLVTLSWEPRKIYGIPPSPRGYHTTIIHDSRLFVIGGFNGVNVFDEVWTLDLAGSSFLPQITNFEVVVDEEEEDGVRR